ncbi:uncharacterized protein BP5553_08874 [Venustampulla echinocandica]|uniref:Uncharacterized protein n=1 Tax=Venustampulla echinocandica TaxID=2656787 RepID=A0A370TD71_9HELO|nr:uncharacterized protein BP5553_08874 [Venustampulla echinocandica]RDL32418.1 hypothetical protein BP5553_08874 [Venustampulla echinocandica]
MGFHHRLAIAVSLVNVVTPLLASVCGIFTVYIEAARCRSGYCMPPFDLNLADTIAQLIEMDLDSFSNASITIRAEIDDGDEGKTVSLEQLKKHGILADGSLAKIEINHSSVPTDNLPDEVRNIRERIIRRLDSRANSVYPSRVWDP